ncbi:MAG: hypothetical protein AAFV80_06390 [Bacteroidota bacterium]
MDKDLHERLRKYLEHQLSAEERAYVDQQIQSDPQWATALQLMQQIRSSARAEVGVSIRQQLEEELERPTTRVKWLRPAIGIAASLALLIACWWMLQSAVAPSQVFANSFEVPKASLARDLGPQNVLNSLLDAYNQGNFDPILEQGPALLTDETIDYTSALAFHLGIAQLQNAQADLALNTFTQVDPESNFHFDALWFKALANLSLDKVQEAKGLLNSLPEKYISPNGRSAKQVLKKLK